MLLLRLETLIFFSFFVLPCSLSPIQSTTQYNIIIKIILLFFVIATQKKGWSNESVKDALDGSFSSHKFIDFYGNNNFLILIIILFSVIYLKLFI